MGKKALAALVAAALLLVAVAVLLVAAAVRTALAVAATGMRTERRRLPAAVSEARCAVAVEVPVEVAVAAVALAGRTEAPELVRARVGRFVHGEGRNRPRLALGAL